MSIGWPLACALTLGVEVPLAVLLAPAGRRGRIAGDAALLNLFTHPLAWLAVHGQGAPLLLVELAVTLVEGLGYWRVTRLAARRAALIAIVCNATTTAIGIAIGWAARRQ